MKLAAILLGILISATGIARADDDFGDPQPRPQVGNPQRGQRMQKLRRALVEQFDRDGDGRLNPRERRQAARALRRMAKRMGENRRQRLIQKYDLDGDGNLGPGELPPRVQQKLRRLDRNGDGWLDQRDQQPRRPQQQE